MNCIDCKHHGLFMECKGPETATLFAKVSGKMYCWKKGKSISIDNKACNDFKIGRTKQSSLEARKMRLETLKALILARKVRTQEELMEVLQGAWGLTNRTAQEYLRTLEAMPEIEVVFDIKSKTEMFRKR
jgi:hypothetical protein